MRLDDKGRLLIKELHSKKDGRVARLYYGNILIFEDTGEVGSIPQDSYIIELEKWKVKNEIDDVDKYIQQAKILDEQDAIKIAEEENQRKKVEEERLHTEEDKRQKELTIFNMVPQISTEVPEYLPQTTGKFNEHVESISSTTIESESDTTSTTETTVKEDIPISVEVVEEKNKKKNKGVYYVLLAFLLTLFLSIIGYFSGYLNLYPINKIHIDKNPDTEEEITKPDSITVIRAIENISSGTEITASMLGSYTISADEFSSLSSKTYIEKDGTTSNNPLVIAKEASKVIGSFATKDISKGKYITVDDFSSQKVVSEKTFVEIDVNGDAMSIPVDSLKTTNTTVKIVALIQSSGQNGTTAVTLAEFVLKDRSLEDIFNSAGQSILEQITMQNVEKNALIPNENPAQQSP